jgi:uncharacterized protein (TIGR02186 family)
VIAALRLIAGSLAVLVLQCSFAGAEQLIATVAPSTISIGSSYSGGHIVVFGAIANRNTSSLSYDAVVTVAGPRQNLLVRRKERVLGIWINRYSRTFADVPSFLAVFANRQFDAIASTDTLRHHRIGLKHSIFVDKTVDADDPFQTNLIRTRIDEGHYIEQPKGVSFVSPAVFRAEIPLPKSALIGAYDVDLKIFANGAPVAQTRSTFNVEKVGVAQFVVKSSVDHSLIYGIATMGMALLTGWIASVAFRRG